MKCAYQLTKYPVGSKREFWTLTWPLMIGLISTTLMMFVDRLFLAHYDPLALNASATGGMAYYLFLVIPMGVASIAEVMVGRLHGEEKFKEAGTAAWQMFLFSLIVTPVFWIIGLLLPPLLFSGTGNEIFETQYFQTLMYFAPMQCTTIALTGFFIGIGYVKIITFTAIIGNIVNIGLDYVFIFGWNDIPPMGVTGAALGTGLSQIAQTVFLLFFYWNRTLRKTFGTSNILFNKAYLMESLKIGLPSGSGRFSEVLAHFVFFRIVMTVGPEQMTIVTMVQTLYILYSFVIDAASKGASAIVANLLGAKVLDPLDKVMRSSFLLHALYFLIVFVPGVLFPEFFIRLFSSSDEAQFFLAPGNAATFHGALIAMSAFFLFDGFCWILAGYLTSSGDTRFLFLVSLAINWTAYILPCLYFVGYAKGGADVAWLIIMMVSLITFLLYFQRYRSGKWIQGYLRSAA